MKNVKDKKIDDNRDNEDKRGIFLGIIGVLTLIVAIIGASVAYFSVRAKSDDDAIKVNAASVQIVYDDGDSIAISDLIPSSKEVMVESIRRALAGESGSDGKYQLCKDDNKRTVCGVYEFTLTNNGSASMQIKASVEPTALKTQPDDEKETGFTNLKYAVYDITDNNKNDSPLYEGSARYTKFGLFDDSGNLVQTVDGNGKSKKYRLVFWLEEKGASNNDEQGAVFKGTVKVDVVGASSK